MTIRRLFFLILGVILVMQIPGEPARAATIQASSISVQMSNPSCSQVVAVPGQCALQFGYLVASGSDPSFSRVEVRVNGKLRVYEAGFFEASAYLSDPMLGRGLIVACGQSGSGGQSGFGQNYLLSASAYMADGTSASDSDSVLCPAYDGKAFFPFVRK